MKDDIRKKAWELEYKQPAFIVQKKVRSDVVAFFKWYKNYNKYESYHEHNFIDIGCGIGTASYFFAEKGIRVKSIDFSKNALSIAESKNAHTLIEYKKVDIRKTLPFRDNYFDGALDIMTSNALTCAEQDLFISEIARVLKPNGIMCVRTLAREGDKNAKYLLTHHAVKGEKSLYKMPSTSIIERVDTESDIKERYQDYFNILFMKRTSNYQRINSILYKRYYWVFYVQKR